jgi:hypothetical protein
LGPRGFGGGRGRYSTIRLLAPSWRGEERKETLGRGRYGNLNRTSHRLEAGDERQRFARWKWTVYLSAQCPRITSQSQVPFLVLPILPIDEELAHISGHNLTRPSLSLSPRSSQCCSELVGYPSLSQSVHAPYQLGSSTYHAVYWPKTPTSIQSQRRQQTSENLLPHPCLSEQRQRQLVARFDRSLF